MSEPARGAEPAVAIRVLVVDDIDDNRDLLTRRLRRKGFEAAAAEDGPTALRLLDEEDFDVVVLDWMMPGMSGLEVLAEIRGRHGKTELPVLMATAKTESDAVVEALKLGANDYVSKPIDFPVLVARLEAQLSMRDEAKEARAPVIDLRDGVASGTVIDGRYEIEDKVGEGGFAAVYRAKQLSTGKDVAFKLMLPHRARRQTGDVELARFLREMRVIADIDHPHVVRLVDSGTIDVMHGHYGAPPVSGASDSSDDQPTVAERGISGTQRTGASDEEGGELGAVPYLVMEFLDGEPLSELLERNKPMEVEPAVDLVIPMLCALGVAHAKGVVHRDVKPHNVLVVEDHQGNRLAKVLDFGIAKLTEPGNDDLTKSDAFIGTPEYMAPEQGRGKKDIDGRADQFSVGAILYQAVTGQRLYDEESFLAMIHAVAAAAFSPPKELGCALPEDFEAVLLKALSRSRDDRYVDAYAFAQALSPFASGRIQRRYADELAAGGSEVASQRSTKRSPKGGRRPDDVATIRSEAAEDQDSEDQHSRTVAMSSEELATRAYEESVDTGDEEQEELPTAEGPVARGGSDGNTLESAGDAPPEAPDGPTSSAPSSGPTSDRDARATRPDGPLVKADDAEPGRDPKLLVGVVLLVILVAAYVMSR